MSFSEDKIRVTCIGDLMPSDTHYSLGTGIGSRMKDLTEYYSNESNRLVNNTDFIFCNLESPILIKSGEKQIPFEGNPDVISLIKSLSISMVSVANNHMLDHGSMGLTDTVQILKENGIGIIGIKKKGNISDTTTISIKNKKFALAAFNAIKDHPDNDYIANLDREILLNTLSEIKKTSPDYIIFSFHWGNEYVNFPSPSQVDLAHEMVDKGVNIIIGHHPHVVQPIEKYKNGVIIYSLGNFLFDMFWSENVRNGIQVDLFLGDNHNIDYNVKHFRIRSDFTHDFINTKAGTQIFERAQIKFKKMIESPRSKYEREYIKDCKKNRLKARLLMKIFLMRKIFRLSPESRKAFLNNFKDKMLPLWLGD